MSLALVNMPFYQTINHPNNPAYPYLKDKRIEQDIWVIRETLPHLAEEAHKRCRQKLYWKSISLRWLKELTKLTVLIATGNRRWGLATVDNVFLSVKRFNKWLIEQEYVTESCLSQQVIAQWAKVTEEIFISGLRTWTKILYQIQCISFEVDRLKGVNNFQNYRPKSARIIPEQVKYELDFHLNTLEPTIYLAIKLLESLGLRSIELSNIPLNCLRKRGDVTQVRIATGKQDGKEKERDIPDELVLLIQQQQQKVKSLFGQDFFWLIPNWEVNGGHSLNGYTVYDFFPEQLKNCSSKINRIIKNIIRENNICHPNGQLAHITTHDFRRSYATVADRMGKRPDQIQHGLRHLNLDMQDSYVNVSPQEQEKRIKRTLVNKDGEIKTYKTDKDAETLRVEWKLRQVENGICTRPNIMNECEYEYVCLGCDYVRFSQEHLPKLLEVRKNNLEFLNKCIEQGLTDSRRANSIRQLLDILDKIIYSLLSNLKQEN